MIRLALLGTGNVGQAVIARLEALDDPGLCLVHISNTRVTVGPSLRESAPHVVLDATASDAVAARHADWLARGWHVVTANKLGRGASLARAEAIENACHASGARYGDAATVGAGLPLLRSLRALQVGGDAIHGVAGVLSGSLAWLLARFDGSVPFSTLVREARAAGYTEPDPRIDLSGEDVRRKLLILARAAGVPLEADAVQVESLVPQALAQADDIDAALDALDAPMHARLDAVREGRLHFVARWRDGIARVGLETLAPNDPLAAGSGTDNRVAIHSARYAHQPLVIQGPGAGAEVTAAAMLDDVFALRDQPTFAGTRSSKNVAIGIGRAIA
ncbi:homoserine dehydrogenase [Noviluteimonas gilva]|uniref:homoserine dehydrogenase n=1 Tax=Noviluteimonas gilva TaxID=2682097 RepID=A0A7C9HWP9_9GAMM|nr:homoserine dehydrogenase [Lysobacter gilvus]